MRLLSKTTSNASLVKPVEDKMIGFFSLKLWSHVACTMHCSKSQVSVITFKIASHLIIHDVWPPVFGNVPTQR